MISSGSGRSVDTSPWFVSWGVPRTLRCSLLSHRCPSGTRRTNCTTYVPVSSMTTRSVVFTLTPTNPPFDHFVSPGFACQTHSATVVRFTSVEEHQKIETMLNQPGQQWASGFQSDSRMLFQEVLEGPRKSLHRLNSTLVLSITLALALGKDFRHNFAVLTVLDGVAKSDNTLLLMDLRTTLLTPRSQGRPSEPLLDADAPHPTTLDESKCLDTGACHVLCLRVESTELLGSFLLPLFLHRLCDDQAKVLGHERMQSTNFETAGGKRCALPLQLRMAKTGAGTCLNSSS